MPWCYSFLQNIFFFFLASLSSYRTRETSRIWIQTDTSLHSSQKNLFSRRGQPVRPAHPEVGQQDAECRTEERCDKDPIGRSQTPAIHNLWTPRQENTFQNADEPIQSTIISNWIGVKLGCSGPNVIKFTFIIYKTTKENSFVKKQLATFFCKSTEL